MIPSISPRPDVAKVAAPCTAPAPLSSTRSFADMFEALKKGEPDRANMSPEDKTPTGGARPDAEGDGADPLLIDAEAAETTDPAELDEDTDPEAAPGQQGVAESAKAPMQNAPVFGIDPGAQSAAPKDGPGRNATAETARSSGARSAGAHFPAPLANGHGSAFDATGETAALPEPAAGAKAAPDAPGESEMAGEAPARAVPGGKVHPAADRAPAALSEGMSIRAGGLRADAAVAGQGQERPTGEIAATSPSGQTLATAGAPMAVEQTVSLRGQVAGGQGSASSDSAGRRRDAAHADAEGAATAVAMRTPGRETTSTKPPVDIRLASSATTEGARTGERVFDIGGPSDPMASPYADSRAATGSQALATVHPSRSDHAQAVVRQMTEALGQTRNGSVELSLNPEELGRVRMSMASTEHGLVMHITSERPETLDLLRRNIDQLHRDLSDLGYTRVDFTFGDQRREQPGASDPARTAPRPSADAVGPVRAGNHQSLVSMTAVQDGLDIRL